MDETGGGVLVTANFAVKYPPNEQLKIKSHAGSDILVLSWVLGIPVGPNSTQAMALF